MAGVSNQLAAAAQTKRTGRVKRKTNINCQSRCKSVCPGALLIVNTYTPEFEDTLPRHQENEKKEKKKRKRNWPPTL